MPHEVPMRVRTLIDNFLGDHGKSPVALRRAVFARAHALGGGGGGPPEVADGLADWVDKIACNPSTATDADVDGLRSAGYAEDDIIEVTEAAALGASMARLEIAYRVIGDDR